MTSKIENKNLIEFSPLCIGRLDKSNELSKVLSMVDTVHLDIMDNTFVKSKAFSVDEINNFKSNKSKHIHIMSKDLDKYISRLKNLDSVSFHYEAVDDHIDVIKKIKKKNFRAGLVVKSETSIDEVKYLFPNIDRLILMAVPPGFSGQKFLTSTTEKIKQVRDLDSDIHIAIDGGMNEQTMYEVTSAGANSCVVCSVIIKSKNFKEKIFKLKEMCEKGTQQFLKRIT